ncbi:MAG: hypothetical protein IJK22_10285 [Bacteroidales bacterium]|nr:hypothetical protein [Bacteroidales bacterium]
MKKILTLFAALVLLAVGATAQKLSYQAVVRNSTTNELVPEATVSVSLKILAADGVTVQYAETQTATTNQNGVLSLIIGEHPTETYTLDDVNWENASIKTEITLPSGDVVTNTMPVTAVPYALFAKNASEMPDVSNFVTTEALQNAGYLTTETDPTVKDATLSVQIGNGNPIQVFSANASEDAVITIPEMPDVSNFVTTEALQNAGYLTTETDPTVKDATLSVQIGNGNPVQVFSANASEDAVITIPEMPDMSSYVTTEALQNAGYLTTEIDPTVKDATLSVQIGNGNPVQVFSANASEDAVITIPEMPDVSNFVTTEALQNAGYLTTETDPTVKDATLSVQIGNGNPIQVFSANASEDAVITIPEMPDVSNFVTTEALQNAGYLTSYTETQNLADVTANGNSAGNRQLKNVSDPTDAQDAVTKNYLTAQMDALTASIQQQLNSIVSGLQHQIDSLGGVVSAQQATIDQQQATIEEHQAVIDSIRNSNGGTTPIVPTVTTGDATSVTETSATLNATITNPDNVTITAIGFSYNASGSNTHMSVEGTGNGNSFTVNLTGLTPGTEYSYHAFIVTDDDVMYDGGVKTFTTTAVTPTTFTCGDDLTVGNYSYTTNQYGSQCWMTQNLRNANGSEVSIYWPEVLTACPTGWHLPNQEEWNTLGNNLPSSPVNFGYGEFWTATTTPYEAGDGYQFTTITPPIVQNNNVSYNYYQLCDVTDYGRSCFAITGDNALYASFIRCVLDKENAPVVSPAAVGDILLEDDTWVSPNDFNATTMTANGVIFHVDETGQHGWAVNLHDEQNGSGFQWSTAYTDIADIPNYDSGQAANTDTAGYQNTQAIRLTGDAQTYPAAYAVSITDGCYLPASGQLLEILQNKTTVNNSLVTVNGTVIDEESNYWSSTESEGCCAWAVYVSWNYWVAYDKTTSINVRSIRSF